MNVVTEQCPGCGRPFATEVTLAKSHTVICQNGHTWKVVSVETRPGKRTFELEMKEREDGTAAASR